jgi:hypothetical protein
MIFKKNLPEEAGFEPTVAINYDNLASCCFKPLSHSSIYNLYYYNFPLNTSKKEKKEEFFLKK